MLLPEWHAQSGVLICWPHVDSDWDSLLDGIEPEYDALAAAISRREQVLIACRDEAHRGSIRRRLLRTEANLDCCRLVVEPYNDTWVRDYGPLTTAGEHGVDLCGFTFNAWGGKYPFDLDSQFTARLHRRRTWGEVMLRHSPLVAEGGAIETDGRGLVITTGGCLDSPLRNPGRDRIAIAEELLRSLGATKVCWLEVEPLAGDDTDGHVDTLARFCPDNVIAHASAPDPNALEHDALRSLADQLGRLEDPTGAPFRLVDLPLPGVIHSTVDGRRLAASYANFLVINGAVLCPQFGDPKADAVAIERLANCFPGREVVPLPSRVLIEQNGSIHCATMQLPIEIPIVVGDASVPRRKY